jgi:hypothetical protein
MRTIKNIFTAGCLLLTMLLAEMPAEAQFFGGTPTAQSISAFPNIMALNTGTNFITSGTNATVSAIDMYNCHTLYLQIGGSVTNATNNAAYTVTFATSPDGVTVDTTSLSKWQLTLNLTATTNWVSTNWDFGAARYVIPFSATNNAGQGSSGLTVKYGLKPGF